MFRLETAKAKDSNMVHAEYINTNDIWPSWHKRTSPENTLDAHSCRQRADTEPIRVSPWLLWWTHMVSAEGCVPLSPLHCTDLLCEAIWTFDRDILWVSVYCVREPKTWSFPQPNQVVRVPEPNEVVLLPRTLWMSLFHNVDYRSSLHKLIQRTVMYYMHAELDVDVHTSQF